MYEQYFGFREQPFRITPDPRFLYRNPCVEEAAAALAYGIERRKGFCSLVGEAGTGKTTLLRHVLDTLSGNVRTVLLLHPTVGFDEILEYILSELGIPTEGARKLVLLQRLHEFLLEHTHAGGNVALLIDEAQDLDALVLEELRLLSNLETGTEKILQIVLAGQPELEAKLADPSLRQLRQRIALHVRLRPLSPDEVAAYIRTRLELAGATRTDVFTPDAVARLVAVSGGIPRILNVLCDAALVTAFATNARQVTATIVDEASADYARLVGEPFPGTSIPQPAALPVARATAPVVPPPVPVPVPTTAVAPPAPPASVAPPAEVPRRVPVRSPPPEPPAPPPVHESAAPQDPSDPWAFSPRQITVVFVAVLLALATLNVRRPGDFARQLAPGETPPVAESPPPLPPPVPAVVPAPSAPEARAVVHQFLLAWEGRDVERLMALFAGDAEANAEKGAAAIRAEYERTFAGLADVAVSVPRVDAVERGDRITVSGPLVVSYRDRDGAVGRMRGTAEWEIAVRDGAPRIVHLRQDVTPDAS